MSSDQKQAVSWRISPSLTPAMGGDVGMKPSPTVPHTLPIPLQQPSLHLNQFIPVLVWVFTLKNKADSGGV